MSDTSKELENFFEQLDAMELPKSLKNEVGKVARTEGLGAAEALLQMSVEKSRGEEYTGPKPKRKPSAPKMLGGRVYAPRKVRSI